MFVVPSDLYCSSWRQSSSSSVWGSFCVAKHPLFSTFLSRRMLFKGSFSTSCCRRRMPRVGADATTVAVAMETRHQLNGRGVRKCECHDLYDVLVPYVDAWNWQKSLVASRCTALEGELDLVDSVAILQHPSVYTMGTRSSDKFLHFDKQNPPFELYKTERGGEVTYHGPGQLVMYPILNLRRYKMDLHWYLRSLEEVVIRAIWSSCGIRASRIDGLTGVWIGDQKVAAIGVRVSHWITYHGLALNVDVDIAPFKNIVPCGITDKFVGRIIDFLDPGLTKGSQHEFLHQHCRNNSGSDFLKAETLQTGNANAWLKVIHDGLMVEFSEVFDVELVVPTLDGPFGLSQSLITN